MTKTKLWGTENLSASHKARAQSNSSLANDVCHMLPGCFVIKVERAVLRLSLTLPSS